MESKKCTCCGEIKLVSEFWNQKHGKFGVRAACKICDSAKYSAYRKSKLEKYAEYSRIHRATDPNYASYDSLRKKKSKLTIDGFASKLFSSSKNRAKKKNLDFDLSTSFIREMLVPLKCAATGFDLVLDDNLTGRIGPLLPSLDRIDSSRGYLKDNVRLVCWWWNVMKQDWQEDLIIELINKYKNEQQK